MGTIRRRGATYRAEVYRQGVRASATFPTRQEAVDWIVTKEADLLAGGGARPSGSLQDAIAHYQTMRYRTRSDRARLGAIARLPWASAPLTELRPESIAAWRDERSKTVRPATIRREMTALRAVLEVARRELGWIKTNPIKEVRLPGKPPPRRRTISDEERDAIVAALRFDGQRVETIGHETAVAFLLALETGMRAGEILALAPGDVDLKRRIAILHTSKTGVGRDVPLSRRAIALFEAMARKRMLRIRTHRHGKIFHVDSDSLDVTFRRARATAGLAGLTFHDARATAVTRMAQILSPYDLARMVGHSSLAMTMLYYRLSPDEIAKRLG